MIVLDTSVVSELRHGKPKRPPNARVWAAGVCATR